MGSCPIVFLGLSLRLTLTVALVTVLHLLGWTYSDLVAEQDKLTLVLTSFMSTVLIGCLSPPTAVAACRRTCCRLAYRLRRHIMMTVTGMMMMAILMKIIIDPSHHGEEQTVVVCSANNLSLIHI